MRKKSGWDKIVNQNYELAKEKPSLVNQFKIIKRVSWQRTDKLDTTVNRLIHF